MYSFVAWLSHLTIAFETAGVTRFSFGKFAFVAFFKNCRRGSRKYVAAAGDTDTDSLRVPRKQTPNVSKQALEPCKPPRTDADLSAVNDLSAAVPLTCRRDRLCRIRIAHLRPKKHVVLDLPE